MLHESTAVLSHTEKSAAVCFCLLRLVPAESRKSGILLVPVWRCVLMFYKYRSRCIHGVYNLFWSPSYLVPLRLSPTAEQCGVKKRSPDGGAGGVLPHLGRRYLDFLAQALGEGRAAVAGASALPGYDRCESFIDVSVRPLPRCRSSDRQSIGRALTGYRSSVAAACSCCPDDALRVLSFAWAEREQRGMAAVGSVLG